MPNASGARPLSVCLLVVVGSGIRLTWGRRKSRKEWGGGGCIAGIRRIAIAIAIVSQSANENQASNQTTKEKKHQLIVVARRASERRGSSSLVGSIGFDSIRSFRPILFERRAIYDLNRSRQRQKSRSCAPYEQVTVNQTNGRPIGVTSQCNNDREDRRPVLADRREREGPSAFGFLLPNRHVERMDPHRALL